MKNNNLMSSYILIVSRKIVFLVKLQYKKKIDFFNGIIINVANKATITT